MSEQLPTTEQIEAFLKGKPVSDEFLIELEEHTKVLVEKLGAITGDLQHPDNGSLEDWNPDQAGAELSALFKAANEICSKPIYASTNIPPQTKTTKE